MIWLPPSEGKTPPTHGPVLDLAGLALPELTAARREVAEALIRVSASPQGAEILGVGPRSRDDLVTNVHLWDSPSAPAAQLYTGVLFEAADLAGAAARGDVGHAAEPWIFSGLFGVLRPGDLVPDHRLSMGTRLPGPGGLAAYWRPRLEAALRPVAENRVVVDLRSGPYRSACPAPWAHTLRVDVVRDTDGRRTVVSHHAKHWRGLLCAQLSQDTGDVLAGSSGTDGVQACVQRIRDLAPTMVTLDARGQSHHVTGIEASATRTTSQGGSLTTLTLVTAQAGSATEAATLPSSTHRETRRTHPSAPVRTRRSAR